MTPAVDAAAVRAGIVVDVAGLAVLLAADDPERAEAVASLFRDAVPLAVDPAWVVRFGARAPEPPDRPPDVRSGPISQWWSDGEAYFDVAGVRARVTAGSVTVGGDGGALAPRFRNVCIQALAQVFAADGRFLVHGAVVVSPAGALLVVGDSGVGKSTLAFAAHRAGWGVVGDDVVVLDAPASDGPVTATGVPRPMAVAADVVAGTGVGGRAVPDDPRARLEVGSAGRVLGPVAVAGLAVAVGARPGGPSIEPLDGPGALRAVLRVMLAFATPAHRATAFAAAGVVARLPSWSLARGADVGAALDDAAALLDDLAGGLAGPARRGGHPAPG